MDAAGGEGELAWWGIARWSCCSVEVGSLSFQWCECECALARKLVSESCNHQQRSLINAEPLRRAALSVAVVRSDELDCFSLGVSRYSREPQPYNKPTPPSLTVTIPRPNLPFAALSLALTTSATSARLALYRHCTRIPALLT